VIKLQSSFGFLHYVSCNVLPPTFSASEPVQMDVEVIWRKKCQLYKMV